MKSKNLFTFNLNDSWILRNKKTKEIIDTFRTRRLATDTMDSIQRNEPIELEIIQKKENNGLISNSLIRRKLL